MSTRSKGTIKYTDAQKGFGYIARPGQPDLFFHHSNILGDDPQAPQKGDVVMFDEVKGQRGMMAVNICNLNDLASVKEQDAWLTRSRQVDRKDWNDTRVRMAEYFKTARRTTR